MSAVLDFRHRTSRRVIALAAVTAATLAVGASIQAKPAHAWSVDNICYLTWTAPGWRCGLGPKHSLTVVQTWNTYWSSNLVGAFALDASQNGYANPVYGRIYACHPYSGNNQLYGYPFNADSIYQHMDAQQAWGSGGPNC